MESKECCQRPKPKLELTLDMRPWKPYTVRMLRCKNCGKMQIQSRGIQLSDGQLIDIREAADIVLRSV